MTYASCFAILVINAQFDTNNISPAFFKSLPPEFRATCHPCELRSNTHFCNGTVDLTWSFPYQCVKDQAILRRLFTSTFHIRAWSKVESTDEEMLISRSTIADQLWPFLELTPPTEASREELYILTSCVADDADECDWYKTRKLPNVETDATFVSKTSMREEPEYIAEYEEKEEDVETEDVEIARKPERKLRISRFFDKKRSK